METSKDQPMRVEECINIRKQLEQIGVTLTSTINKNKIAKGMNAFIKDAQPCTLKINMDSKVNVVIQLSNNIHRQSGITLEKL